MGCGDKWIWSVSGTSKALLSCLSSALRYLPGKLDVLEETATQEGISIWLTPRLFSNSIKIYGTMKNRGREKGENYKVCFEQEHLDCFYFSYFPCHCDKTLAWGNLSGGRFVLVAVAVPVMAGRQGKMEWFISHPGQPGSKQFPRWFSILSSSKRRYTAAVLSPPQDVFEPKRWQSSVCWWDGSA